MKRLLLSLLMLVAVFISRADTALIVHQKSGGTVEYAFSEKPVVTFSGSYLVITFKDDVFMLFPLSDMQKFTFDEVDSNTWEDRITVPKELTPQPTYIYNMGGILVRTFQPSNDGCTPANVNGLPAGTYIIKNGNTSYKVKKK
jgi:hypothetical protein